MGYTVKIREILRDFGAEYVKMIEFKIIRDSGKFGEGSEKSSFSVTDGTNTVTAFSIMISPGGKEYLGYFTVDAFDSFAPGVMVTFGSSGFNYFTVNEVDLSSKVGLYSILAGIPRANAFKLSVIFQDIDYRNQPFYA